MFVSEDMKKSQAYTEGFAEAVQRTVLGRAAATRDAIAARQAAAGMLKLSKKDLYRTDDRLSDCNLKEVFELLEEK
jgi:hypothetical protein